MTKKTNKIGPTNNRTRSTTFFATCPWPEWKDEFNQALAPNGGRKYKTAWSFAKAKGKTEDERKLIYEAIGPQPTVTQTRVKWLGDWQKEREEKFFAQTQEKVDALAHKFDENIALRSQLAKLTPFAMRMLNRFAKVADHVDEFYGNELMHPDLDAKENHRRIKHYLKTMGKLTVLQRQAMEQFFLSIGVHPNDFDSWSQIALVALAGEAARQGVQLAAGKTELPRQASAGELPQGEGSGELQWVVAAARMIQNKSKMYAMPLPEVDGETIEVETK